MLQEKVNYFLKKFKKIFLKLKLNHTWSPAYKIIEIYQNAYEEYCVSIQIANKNSVFNSKPEEILSKDDLVDQFSQRDVRTLTYLGYLGINNPKYKVLAKRLSENDDKLLFAIKQKGVKKIIIRTATEITKEKEILGSLSPEDAHMIGYITGSESINNEKSEKNKLV